LLVMGAACALAVPFALDLLPGEALALVVPLAQLTPMLAALLVRHRPGRRRDALALLVPSGRALTLGLLLAVVVFAAVPVLRAVLGTTLGLVPWSVTAEPLMVLVALPVVAILQTLFAIGEETGWRGWLHTQLAPYGLPVTAVVTSLLWTLWHLPIVLVLDLGLQNSIAYLGTILAVSPLLTALREVSGTVWPAVIGHGLLNSLRVAVDQNLLGPAPDAASRFLLEGIGWSLWFGTALVVASLARRATVGPPGRPPHRRREIACASSTPPVWTTPTTR
ncbi:MAG: CPBP family intramembrane metalloprotease, partial [Brachybacterium sp.]|nr:CPBP family intramembrane metalloprotease [Brachybacterium sp.]